MVLSAQIAFVGQPEQGAQAALVAFGGQAELVRLFPAYQVFHIQRDLPWKRLIQREQTARGVLVEPSICRSIRLLLVGLEEVADASDRLLRSSTRGRVTTGSDPATAS